MITIISSKRHAELLAKERAADAISAELQFTASFTKASVADVSKPLHDANAKMAQAYAACEPGSAVRSMIHGAQWDLANVIRLLGA